MSDKLREAPERAHDLSLDGRHEEARAVIREALAADDVVRAHEIANAGRVIAWATEKPRRPANSAFTAGAERQAAYWIEWAECRAAVANGTMQQSERAEWFALAMTAASYIEDAANCLRDEEAKLPAEGAAKHVREKCNALWQASRAAAPQGEVVVTKNKAGQIVCVTRQDADGQILSVIAEADAPQSVEPYGCVTTQTHTGQQVFYRWPRPPYLDNASECVMVYLAPPSAPTDAEWEAKRVPDDILLRAGLDAYSAAQGTAIDRVAAAIRTVVATLNAAAPQSAELVEGAVWHEGSVSLIRRGSEDDYCKRHPGATRIYHRPQQAAPTEADRMDAERYRWLRDVGDSTWASMGSRVDGGGPVIDKAIDAAMSAQAGGKEQGLC